MTGPMRYLDPAADPVNAYPRQPHRHAQIPADWQKTVGASQVEVLIGDRARHGGAATPTRHSSRSLPAEGWRAHVEVAARNSR